MHSFSETVGVISCPTNLATIKAIAAANGLNALQGGKPHVFCLANSGRSMEPEVGEELFEVFQTALDKAAGTGKIPPWSVVGADD